MKRFTLLVLPGPLLVLGLIVGVQSAYAAAGSLDPNFGNGGVTITTSSTGFIVAYSLKLQNDVKILVLVQTEDETSGVLRYTSSGDRPTKQDRAGRRVFMHR